MADAIQSLTALTNNATLQNNVDVADADNVNADRLAQNTEINLHKTVLEEQESNYASPTEPTNKPEGKIWCDTTSDPAIWKGYNDGAGNTTTFVGGDSTQALTNKTYINPTFSPAGANGYIDLKRDLNLKIINNTTNFNYQVDVTFDYLTLYDTNGRGVVESQTSALTLDLSVLESSGGNRANSESSGAEQSNTWYYIYVYSDGGGAIDGLLAQASDWADVITNGDNPTGSDYVRRVGAVRNDSGSDLFYFYQINDYVGIEKPSADSIGTETNTSWQSRDISALVPEITTGVTGTFYGSGGDAYIAAVNTVSSRTTAPGVAFKQDSSGANRDYFMIRMIEPQTVYTAVSGGTSAYGISGFFINL